MMIDYKSYIGRQAVVVRPVYENIDDKTEYFLEENPSWNHVGAILLITSSQKDSDDRCSFSFIECDHPYEHHGEVLLDYDFQNGFVKLLDDMDEENEEYTSITELI